MTVKNYVDTEATGLLNIKGSKVVSRKFEGEPDTLQEYMCRTNEVLNGVMASTEKDTLWMFFRVLDEPPQPDTLRKAHFPLHKGKDLLEMAQSEENPLPDNIIEVLTQKHGLSSAYILGEQYLLPPSTAFSTLMGVGQHIELVRRAVLKHKVSAGLFGKKSYIGDPNAWKLIQWTGDEENAETTKAFEIAGAGCIVRNTMTFQGQMDDSATSSLVFVPGVRLVPKKDTSNRLWEIVPFHTSKTLNEERDLLDLPRVEETPVRKLPEPVIYGIKDMPPASSVELQGSSLEAWDNIINPRNSVPSLHDVAEKTEVLLVANEDEKPK